ncbi:Uncharacterised protein [Bordetella pertussis]|nr:Uncharacterised protein [Bordetella pertussis]CFP56890.1 Uncharacterised protein [Bordetella pertussis]CFW31369.1 Uncharacterised protein [Bordetella pertussis]
MVHELIRKGQVGACSSVRAAAVLPGGPERGGVSNPLRTTVGFGFEAIHKR